MLIAEGNGTDLFLARYAPDGELVWVTRAGGSASYPAPEPGTSYHDASGGADVAALNDGSAVVTGFFAGRVTFGANEPQQTALESVGGVSHTDLFIARYDEQGGLTWAVRAGGPGSDSGNAIAALSHGGVLITALSWMAQALGPVNPPKPCSTAPAARKIGICSWRATPQPAGSSGYSAAVAPATTLANT